MPGRGDRGRATLREKRRGRSARGGKVVLISDAQGIAQAGENTIATIAMRSALSTVGVAVVKNTDVDQPRNLAKSVTMERSS